MRREEDKEMSYKVQLDLMERIIGDEGRVDSNAKEAHITAVTGS